MKNIYKDKNYNIFVKIIKEADFNKNTLQCEFINLSNPKCPVSYTGFISKNCMSDYILYENTSWDELKEIYNKKELEYKNTLFNRVVRNILVPSFENIKWNS